MLRRTITLTARSGLGLEEVKHRNAEDLNPFEVGKGETGGIV
jgi:hypothetical protein